MNGAVFRVDRQQLRARGVPHHCHQWRRRDQRLLVGERQSFARREGAERDRKAGETHHRVHDHVRTLRETHETLVTHHDRDVRAKEIRQHRTVVLTLYTDVLDVELRGDRREFAQLLAAGNRYEFEALSLLSQHVEGLNTNGARRAEQRHASARGRHR